MQRSTGALQGHCQAVYVIQIRPTKPAIRTKEPRGWFMESTQYYTNSVGSEPFGVDAARVLLGPPSQEKNN
jgi:hypothetical protein